MPMLLVTNLHAIPMQFRQSYESKTILLVRACCLSFCVLLVWVCCGFVFLPHFYKQIAHMSNVVQAAGTFLLLQAPLAGEAIKANAIKHFNLASAMPDMTVHHSFHSLGIVCGLVRS